MSHLETQQLPPASWETEMRAVTELLPPRPLGTRCAWRAHCIINMSIFPGSTTNKCILTHFYILNFPPTFVSKFSLGDYFAVKSYCTWSRPHATCWAEQLKAIESAWSFRVSLRILKGNFVIDSWIIKGYHLDIEYHGSIGSC